MNTQLNTRALAASALCFTIYLVAGRPDPWMQLFIGSGPTVSGWIIGIAEGAVVFAVGGALIGFFYNRLAKTAA